jgi:hypothetical protein
MKESNISILSGERGTKMTGTNFSSFTNYKQTVIELTSDLKKLREFGEKLKLEGNVSAINDVLKRLTEDTFNVAIVGEFKRGKSTLINALLEKDVLPTDVVPTTATLNKVTYSVTPFVRIEYNDGKTEDIDIDKLNDYVTKLTPESEKIAKTVKVATVYYPVNYCKNGVTIIDTPGLNDDEAMTNVTLSVLPQIDAAIMVMMAGSPFSQYECDFLENKVITSDLGRVLFVVTGIDLYDEEDAQKILKVITKRITDSVLLKAKNTYGEGSKQYENYQRKLGNIRVYGLSAKKALKAKQKGDNKMLQDSMFPEFEAALERFLTEDRGAVMLNVPISRIKTSSIELVKAVQLRETSLSMQKDEFNAKYNKAMEEIEGIRRERQAEFSRINEAAQKTYNELAPAIKNYWPTLEKAADDAIDSFHISSVDEIKEPALQSTQESMTKAVKNAVSKVSQNVTERIQDSINLALENEAERISGFENEFFKATERIQNLFVEQKFNSNSGDAVISTITNSVVGFGLGGVYMGFKESGWKGALLGGATGFAGMAIGNIGLFGLLLPALAIPVTWPVAIIGGLAVGILSTFSSKWALNKVFAKDKIEKFKSSFKEAISKELSKMKAEDNFSENVRRQVDAAFDALKTKIKTETEHILGDTQNQLTQLKVELAQADVSRSKEKEELKEMLVTIDQICTRADEISKQLTAVLAR